MSAPDIILSFDTAMNACGGALYNAKTNETLAAKHEPMNRGQAERLIPMIDEIIKSAGIEYKDIDLIACTHGPGAFTGLRLSLATAKALSLSLNRPVMGISTLEAILYSADITRSDTNNTTLSCLETKRKDYYIQAFDRDKTPLTDPKSAPLEEVKKILNEYTPLIIGDAVKRLSEETNQPNIKTKQIQSIDCTALAKMAKRKYTPGCCHIDDLTPLYLREADVSFPATKK